MDMVASSTTRYVDSCFVASKKIKTIDDVVAWRMCVGCGACKAVCPQQRIHLVDVINDGIRPETDGSITCQNCKVCLAVCPGIEITNDTSDNQEIKELKAGWGTILEVYEGYATDRELRFNGSSGGVANALALFCIEKLGMSGVVHTKAHEDGPWRNKVTFSTSKEEIVATSGSRYSPASPAEGISRVLSENGNAVFIGKPCDIAAYYKATKIIPELKKKTGLTIGIFCAGTPSTQGTLDLLKKIGADQDKLSAFRYRGRGWPGMCAIKYKNDSSFTDKMTYMESWGFIQKYRPVRCYQCPDGTSELADIACGDPWHQKAQPGESGLSLVLARTQRGKQIIEQAISAGVLHLRKTQAASLIVAQKNLLNKRSWVWGRLTTLRLLGIPAPVFNNYSLFKLWMKSSLEDKLRSIYGTFRRALQRKYWKPCK